MPDIDHSDTESPSAPNADVAVQDFQTFRRSIAELIQGGHFERAIDQLEHLADHPDSTRYLDETIWLHRQLGDLYRAFDREQKALAAYERAYKLDPCDLEVLDGYTEALLGVDDADSRLADVLQSMLVHHKQHLAVDRLGWVYRRLGAHYEKSNRPQKARHAFEKALQKAPDDQHALTGLLRVVDAVGEPIDVIEVRRKLIKSLDGMSARSMALVAMGDDWKEKFNDPWRALDTYEEALAADDHNKRALESIASVARQIGDWRRMSRALFTLHRIADKPADKADWLIESSKIARRELWEPEKALRGFRAALDFDPTRLDAFKEVTSLLADAGDWTGLETAYLQLISANHELDGPDPNLLAVLWEKLGQLYLNHLESRDEALTAYSRAAELMPDRLALHERVAELTEAQADHSDLALEHLHAIQRLDPSRVEVLERIGRVHLRIKDVDPAFVYLRTFDFRGGQLGQKASNFIDKLDSPMVEVPRRPMTKDVLERFVYPDALREDIARMFQLIKPAMVKWVGESRRKYGLGRRDRVKFKEQLAFNNLYKQIGVSLGYDDLPQLWRKPDQIGLLNGALVPEGMIVGDELLGSGHEKKIAFTVGKQLFLFLAPFYLAPLRPVSDLQGFFLLASSLVKPELEFEQDDHSKRAFKALRKNIKGDQRKRLQRVVDQIMSSDNDLDLDTWVEAVEDAANRVGFIYCDDLSVAQDSLHNEPKTLGQRSAAERMDALAEYAVSPRYREIRRELNISVG